MGHRIEVKDKAEVTLNDVISVLSYSEKQALYFEIGCTIDTFDMKNDDSKLLAIVRIIKKITGIDDLWLLYYGRTLLGEIGEDSK